jgi:type IV secretion system protein TrbL
MESHIFADVLALINSAFLPMMSRVRPTIIGLAAVLMAFEATKLASAALMHQPDVGWRFLRWIFKATFITWLLTVSYGSVVQALYQSAIVLGLRAGGGVLQYAEFLDPGQYIAIGFRAGQPLWEQLTLANGLADGFVFAEFALAYLCLIGAYILMAFCIFIAQVEMSVAIIGGLVMLPFMLFSSTAWLSQGSLSYPANKAFRMLILAVLASALFPIIANELSMVNPGSSFWSKLFRGRSAADWTNLQHGAIIIAATWAVALLYLKSASIASGILSGIPTLSGGHALQAAASTVQTAGAVAGGLLSGGATVAAGSLAGASASVAAHRAAPTGTAAGAVTRGLLTGATSSIIPAFQATTSGLQQGLRQGAQFFHPDTSHGGARPQ